MYYKRVNRGLSFTKQGLYLFGFVLIIGMLAVITGVNAFYVVLCALLGLFVVSGVMSEGVLRECSVDLKVPDLVMAGESIELVLKWKNQGSAGAYGHELLVLTRYPSYRILKKKIDALAFDRVDLNGRSTKINLIATEPFARGVYHEFILLQQTMFPFGFLEKYKFKKQIVDMHVFPKLNPIFLKRNKVLNDLFDARFDAGPDFNGHQRFDFSSWKNLDWRRNAFKRHSDWVIRVFKEDKKSTSIAIKIFWSIARNCGNTSQYEEYLENIATIIVSAEKAGHRTNLIIDGKINLIGYEKQLAFLASCPYFNNRDGYEPTSNHDQKDRLFRPKIALRFVAFNEIFKE